MSICSDSQEITLVKNLVELSGGTVEAHSGGEGKGSEFVVRLPLRRKKDYGETGAAPETSNRMTVPRRILVVDDNIDAAETLATLLRFAGHDVQVANDGPSALDSAAEHAPDIVFLDIGMPHMDGLEVARRMRRSPNTEKALLVALRGWGL